MTTPDVGPPMGVAVALVNVVVVVPDGTAAVPTVVNVTWTVPSVIESLVSVAVNVTGPPTVAERTENTA